MLYYLIKDGDKFDVLAATGFKPKGAILIVPTTVDPEDYPFLKAREEADEDGLMRWQMYIDEDLKGQKISEKTKEKAKEDLFAGYYQEIDDEMMLVFGTAKKDKATSLYLTWMMMRDNPEFYADKGLADEKGKALDTATKVYDYANLKMMRALDYSVFLMKRKDKLDKDAKLLE